MLHTTLHAMLYTMLRTMLHTADNFTYDAQLDCGTLWSLI